MITHTLPKCIYNNYYNVIISIVHTIKRITEFSIRNAHTHKIWSPVHYTAVVCCFRPSSYLCFTSLRAIAKFLHLRVCDVRWTAVLHPAPDRRHSSSYHEENSRTLILCSLRRPSCPSWTHHHQCAPAFFGFSSCRAFVACAICSWPSVSTNVS